MVTMKIMGSLILGSYLAIVAFAQDNCISDYNTSICYPERTGCCYDDNGNTSHESRDSTHSLRKNPLQNSTKIKNKPILVRCRAKPNL